MKEGTYTKTLAKIQVRGIFRIRDIRRNVLPKLIEICMRRHAGAHLDELQHGGRKPTETSVTEFCYKSVNLLFEKLINIKVILFLKHSKISWNKSFFNLHDSSLGGRHANAASRKSLEIQAYSITKPRTLLKRKFVGKLVFSCSNTPWK